LERQIHDAEILLQKTVELWTTRSNERELAYEKEMFHSADGNPLLIQVKIIAGLWLCINIQQVDI
jgi:hypothetical protein